MKRTVRVVDAGRTLSVPEGETVLSAALAAGIPYPHSCQAGRCGACKSRLLQGEVELLPHSRFALSPEERSEGLVLDVTDCGAADGVAVRQWASLGNTCQQWRIAP